jgi:formamidase
MECQSREDLDEQDPHSDAILCGPLSVVGAETGDIIVVDILAIGRSDGRYAGAAHPGIIGCAPGAESLRLVETDPEGVLLGHVRPGLAAYELVAAQAVRSAARGREIGSCAIAQLTAGSRIMLPVHAYGAKLSVGDLHFPTGGAEDCLKSALAGWIDLRINLTKRGMERFLITSPLLIPEPDRAA